MNELRTTYNNYNDNQDISAGWPLEAINITYEEDEYLSGTVPPDLLAAKGRAFFGLEEESNDGSAADHNLSNNSNFISPNLTNKAIYESDDSDNDDDDDDDDDNETSNPLQRNLDAPAILDHDEETNLIELEDIMAIPSVKHGMNEDIIVQEKYLYYVNYKPQGGTTWTFACKDRVCPGRIKCCIDLASGAHYNYHFTGMYIYRFHNYYTLY